jgi:serine/threonine protein kinase
MRRIAQYDIVRELGQGGMGIVYEAIQKPLDRRVALKLLHPHMAARPEFSARFIEEARKVARLNHPAIIEIYDFGQVNDTYYLALKFVDGDPLDVVLARERLSTTQAVNVLRWIADGLSHAHTLGIVHRDVKPGNVFLDKSGRIVLGDFGIAKDLDPNVQGLTNPGDVIGTPAYMSPEQAQGIAVSAATDVYSLGVLAFEMLAGRVPFTADTAVALLLKHIYEFPPPIRDIAPGIPSALADLIDSMLGKDPAQRPQMEKAVLASLIAIQKRLESSEQATAPIPSVEGHVERGESYFDEFELTLACFELVGFSREVCQQMLPARVAFLLESWYRLVRHAVYEAGGILDRYVADRATAIFGYPNRHADHAQRALRAARSLGSALEAFNQAHGLRLQMRAGIACGPALVGRINVDAAQTSVQGLLPGDMVTLSKSKATDAPIRLNRAAYRRVSALATFTQFQDDRISEAWATSASET